MTTAIDTQHPLFFNKYGCWVSNNKVFDSKIEAYKNASNDDTQVKFYFHNHIWANFDRSLLGTTSLPNLYRERALQLRDKYKYLVLHYSGGSDSHNILHTFLSNNIKLDEVSVRWTKTNVDGKFHKPNNIDKSARNSLSEWNFTIKPVLDKLAITHPNIKITIVDFMESYELGHNIRYDEDRIIKMNATRGVFGTFVQRINQNVEDKIMSTENAGHIFGVEKPILVHSNDNIYLKFTDAGFDPATMIRGREEKSVELFYWSSEFPQLPMEQAYQTALYFKHNRRLLPLLFSDKPMLMEEANTLLGNQSEIYKSILYSHSWDFSKFQVQKPNADRSDWWHWLHESDELITLKASWKIAMNNVNSGIHPNNLFVSNGVNFLKTASTRLFHILSLN